MDRDSPLTIGLFVNNPHVSALLHPLLRGAGHTVMVCSDVSQPLDFFLEKVIHQIKERNASPYDLLIVAVSAPIREEQTHMLLQQVASFERFPTLLIADTPLNDQKPFLVILRAVPFLSRHLFHPQALMEALERATGVCFSLTGSVAETMLHWQRTQYQEAIQAHQAWIDQRQAWLHQRQTWIHERQTWLLSRAAWLDKQRQQPGAQHDWLDEQQTWVEAQQAETRQQERWLHDQQYWLQQQQHKLHHLIPPFLKQA